MYSLQKTDILSMEYNLALINKVAFFPNLQAYAESRGKGSRVPHW